MIDWPEERTRTLEDLLAICHILRDPECGCPWDKVQTHMSIRKNFLEETCEVLEAIDAGDAHMLREELGDVLMQVALHTCMEEEAGRFTLEDVCREVCEKLIYRHPHIFSASAEENGGLNGWDAIKNKEKGRTGLADELATVPATLPALMYAAKQQKRAARYRPAAMTSAAGADGAPQTDLPQEERPNAEAAQAEAALDAAYAQLKAALANGAGGDALQPQAGAFLYKAVDVLRLRGVDAEEALALTSRGVRQALLENGTCSDETVCTDIKERFNGGY